MGMMGRALPVLLTADDDDNDDAGRLVRIFPYSADNFTSCARYALHDANFTTDGQELAQGPSSTIRGAAKRRPSKFSLRDHGEFW